MNQHLSNGIYIQLIIYMLDICRSCTFIHIRDRTEEEKKISSSGSIPEAVNHQRNRMKKCKFFEIDLRIFVSIDPKWFFHFLGPLSCILF
jgi:hypothetical protein